MEGNLSQQAHGTLILSQLTDYNSSETNHDTGNLYHGYRYSPNGPYNSYINSYQFFPGCGNTLHGLSLQMMDTVRLQYHSYNIYNNNAFHWHPFDRKGYLHQPYQTLPITKAIKGCQFDDHSLVPSSSSVNQFGGFVEINNPYAFGVTYGQVSQRFLYYAPSRRSEVHFSKVPGDGDIFDSQRYDNVVLLDFILTDNPLNHQSLNSCGYSRDRDLYRVHEDNGALSLERTGHKSFTFHEENMTATYYLPDKDIALHFTRVPRDSDIFCSRRIDNVVILEALSMKGSQGHHNEHPRNWDLYRVNEGNGGFIAMKMDYNNMPTKESFVFGRETEEEKSTFTYYLRDKNLAFHFTSLPTHGSIFRSQRRNNIMILDLDPPMNYKEHPEPRSYGSPWDTDFYRVQQKNDGFELERIIHSEIRITVEDLIRRKLKIRRFIASNTSSAKEDEMCTVCLAAFKDFDRIGSMNCGHEYHMSCIIPCLLQNRCCPICKWKLYQGPLYDD